MFSLYNCSRSATATTTATLSRLARPALLCLRFSSTSLASNEPQQHQHNEGTLLSLSERIKSLVFSRKSGTFTTAAFDPESEGAAEKQSPLYGSLMPYLLDKRGIPHFLLRANEAHSKHLQVNNIASLTVFTLTPPNTRSPTSIPLPKVNLTGEVAKIADKEADAQWRKRFVEEFPASEQYMNEFTIHKLYPTSVGFARYPSANLELITEDEYTKASVDPLAQWNRKITDTINSQYRRELSLLCKEYANETAESVFLYWIDRYGFSLIGEREERDSSKWTPGSKPSTSTSSPSSGAKRSNWLDVRLPFPGEITDSDECIRAIQEAIAHLERKL